VVAAAVVVVVVVDDDGKVKLERDVDGVDDSICSNEC